MKSRSYRPSYLSSKYKSKTTKSSLKKIIHSTKKHFRKNKLGDINFFHDPKTNRIYNLRKDKCKVEQLLLRNLLKKTNLNPKKIILPRQIRTNCWFNVLFIIYFISDKGRLFTKPIRYSIIKKKYNTKTIENKSLTKLSNSLFLLNIAIEACSTGSTIAHKIDTNEIIENIYDSIYYKKPWLLKPGEYGNALEYYSELIKYLYPNMSYPISTKIHQEQYQHMILNKNIYVPTKLPHMFIVEISDDESNMIDYKTNTLMIMSTFNNQKGKYSLDCVCLRDVDKSHVSSLFTINKTGYFFDGESDDVMKPLSWNNDAFINSNKNFYIDSKSAQFNFRKGYQILYYYRTK